MEKQLSNNRIIYLSRFVDDKKQSKITQLKFIEDKQNTLLADLIIRSELSKRTGTPNECLRFFSNVFGKPYCLNALQIHYNISHSGEFVVCAISDKPVGIDVEKISEANLKMAKRFFTNTEYEYITSKPENEQACAFSEIWTKKESYIKHEGKGLAIPLKSFDVLDAKNEFYFNNVYISEEMICNVCSCKNDEPSVSEINIDELISIFKKEK